MESADSIGVISICQLRRGGTGVPLLSPAPYPPLTESAGSVDLCGHFSCEVGFLHHNAFTHFKASKGEHLGTGFLGQLTDLDLGVLDERLLDKAVLRQELGNPA